MFKCNLGYTGCNDYFLAIKFCRLCHFHLSKAYKLSVVDDMYNSNILRWRENFRALTLFCYQCKGKAFQNSLTKIIAWSH